jgi:hypothetical protein
MQLAEADADPGAHRHVYPYPFAHHNFPPPVTGTAGGRETPSTTTVSADGGEEEEDAGGGRSEVEVDEETRRWAGVKGGLGGKTIPGRDKGKGREMDRRPSRVGEVPEEVISQVSLATPSSSSHPATGPT